MPRESIKTDSTTWINIYEERDGDYSFLKSEFSVSDDDIEIIKKKNQRTRIEHRDEYTFMVMRFPVYDRRTNEIEPTDVNILIADHHLITLHSNRIPQMNALFQRIQNDETFRKEVTSKGSESLLYHIIYEYLDYCFPMLEHITIDIHTVEKSIFRGKEKAMTKGILVIRRNITDFREIVYHHKDILKKLLSSSQLNAQTTKRETSAYYSDLIEMTKEIWSLLERQKETIEALQETNDNLISFRINDVIIILTMFSAMLLPMSVIFGLFGINTSMSFLPSSPYDFLIVVGIGLFFGSIMAVYFKKKHWI